MKTTLKTKTKKHPARLPNKPSALIRAALRDLELVEKNKKYHVDMYVWHIAPYLRRKHCPVCFAGSVMAMSLNVGIKEESDPGDFPEKTENKLQALNMFRVGFIRQGLKYLDLKPPRGKAFKDFPVVTYEEQPLEFKRQMRELADKLATKGM